MSVQVHKVTELNPQVGMEIADLLKQEGMDSHCLQESELFVRFDSHGRVLGVACVSEFGKDCLISPVIVRGDLRGSGTGSALVNHILGYFSGRCDRVYVVAGEALGFFQRFGFRSVSFDGVPEAITGLCRSRGTLNQGLGMMMLDLPRSWTI